MIASAMWRSRPQMLRQSQSEVEQICYFSVAACPSTFLFLCVPHAEITSRHWAWAVTGYLTSYLRYEISVATICQVSLSLARPEVGRLTPR